jgi:predicted O-linked N-acetylglucosamine transferase (SPINDLY family)
VKKITENLIKIATNKIVQGNYSEAKQDFFLVLEEEPENYEALNSLGLIFANEKNYEKAIEYFSKVIESAKCETQFIKYNRGLCYHKLNRLKEALEDYSNEIAINPNYVDVWYNRAILLSELLNYEESIKNYDQVILLNPLHKESFYNKGLLLFNLNKYEQSIKCFNGAILIDVNYEEAFISKSAALTKMMQHSEAIEVLREFISTNKKAYTAWFNLGTIYLTQKQYENSINSLKNAIVINPLFEEAYLNLGNAYRFNGNYFDSLKAYDSAIDINGNYLDAWINKGVLFQEFMFNKDALFCYEKAINLNHKSVAAWLNKGNTFHNLKRYVDAINCYEHALKIDNSIPEIYFSIGKTLIQMGEYQESLFFFEKLIEIKPDLPYGYGEIINAKTKICHWTFLDQNINDCLRELSEGNDACQPFYMVAINDDLAIQKKCAELYVNKNFPPIKSINNIKRKINLSKIKLAYYSADFHNHATAHLITGLFEHHNKEKFEIYAFSFGPITNDLEQNRIKDSFDFFYTLGDKSDFEIIELSRQIGIDIAIDLKGFTTDSRTRIFSNRVAPIQVNFLGYPGTMGANYIDYLIADEYVVPIDCQQLYTEKIIYLPDCYQVNDSLRQHINIPQSREEFGLPKNAFVYCCFNNNYKITPNIFQVWMNILRSVENSVLWLLEDNNFVAENLKNTAIELGIDPKRIIFAKRTSLELHIARHSFADLFLDTFPCNAHTTASDALRAGLPLITISGHTFSSRVAGSLLKTVGLTELILRNYDDYQSTAVELGLSCDRLFAVKEKLKLGVHQSSLFKPEVFARNLEKSFEKIIQEFNISQHA